VAAVLPIAIAYLAVKALRFRVTPEAAEPEVGCCSKDEQPQTPPWWRFAFVDLVDDIVPLVFFGLIIAALAQVLWPVSEMHNVSGAWDVLVLGLLGIPFYVCASASVPIALVLLQHGFSIGAVLVFLFAGPATNVSTILSVNKVFGQRSGWKLAGLALMLSLIMGYGVNAIYQPGDLGILELHEHGWAWWQILSLAVLCLLGLMSMWRSGPLHWISSLLSIIPGVVHHPPIEAETTSS